MRISDWSSDVCSSDLFRWARFFEKGLSIKAGRTHAQRYLPQLLRFVEEGKLHPDAVITPRLRSEERRVGIDCVRPCRSLWSPSLSNKNFFNIFSSFLHLLSSLSLFIYLFITSF